ncbi:MAG TPA: hypothetical protein VMB84_18705 [Stellaceae bacterium]|nr:hypothetical protein [Stellaceae bacterium]
MRLRLFAPLLLGLAACSSGPRDYSKLTLRNTAWEHVNVQLVVTRAGDCDASGPDLLNNQTFVMRMDQTKTFKVPNGTNACWRHDRYPSNPKPGEWSGWSRAVLFPGEDTSTDL